MKTSFVCAAERTEFCTIKTLKSSSLYRYGHLPFMLNPAVWGSRKKFHYEETLKSMILSAMDWYYCKNCVAEETCLGTIKEKKLKK